MVLYIDSAIFCVSLLNFLCLDTAASVIRIKIKKGRLLAGALCMSGIWLLSLLLPGIRYSYPIMYILFLRLIFGKCSFAELARRCGIALCVGFLYGGVILSVIPPDKICTLTVNGSNFFVAEDLWLYLPLGGVYGLVKVIVFFVSHQKKIYPIRIQLGEKSVATKGFIDTGNSLREPKSGAPVIIAERSLFDEINKDPLTIPFRNIGEDRQYTEAYPVDRLCLLEEKQVYTNIYIAFRTKPLSPVGAYRALLHNSFLERK